MAPEPWGIARAKDEVQDLFGERLKAQERIAGSEPFS